MDPLLGLLIALATIVVAFPVLTFGLPYYLATRRAAELERDLPDALRQMASTLRAGELGGSSFEGFPHVPASSNATQNLQISPKNGIVGQV